MHKLRAALDRERWRSSEFRIVPPRDVVVDEGAGVRWRIVNGEGLGRGAKGEERSDEWKVVSYSGGRLLLLLRSSLPLLQPPSTLHPPSKPPFSPPPYLPTTLVT